MISLDQFIQHIYEVFPFIKGMQPWEITQRMSEIIHIKIGMLDNRYNIRDGIAIHQSATVEDRVILKAPVIIGEDCFIGANAYLRNGVYLGNKSSVGPACEVKSSIIFNHTEIAHLNFIGDSIIGSNINFEAGSITTNYFNERRDKEIAVLFQSDIIKTGVEKFGSLVGDNCKIGANAVLSPGTILHPDTVVKRLQLVEQLPSAG